MTPQLRRVLLRNIGRTAGNHYLRALSALLGDTPADALSIAHAEAIAPSIRHYRRRAKACARLLRKP